MNTLAQKNEVERVSYASLFVFILPPQTTKNGG